VSASDGTLLYLRALELLRRHGFQKPSWLTPVEFARTLPSSQNTELFAEFTGAYNELRFGGRRDAAATMVSMLSRLEGGFEGSYHGSKGGKP
jgi:hypothetical protein